MAAYNNLPLQNNTPVPDDIFFKEHQHSKINIKDQWASHPSRESREKYLLEHAVPAVDDIRPAWILFNQIPQLQEQFSKMIYAELHKPDIAEKIDEKEFTEYYNAEIKKFDLPNEYNGYYDEHKPDECDIEMLCSVPFTGNLAQHEFDSFFNNDWKAYKNKIIGLEQDVSLLESINSKKIIVKTFDYDGNKMKRKDAGKLHQEIDKQLQQSKAILKSHDEKILRFFYSAALNLGEAKGQKLKEKCKTYFAVSKQVDSFLDSGKEITNALAPQNGENVTIPDAIIMARVLRAETDNIKPIVRQWLGEGLFDSRPILKDHAELLTKNSYQYFDKNRFLDHELASIHILINGTAQLLGAYQFSSYKNWLLYQLEIWYEVKAMDEKKHV